MPSVPTARPANPAATPAPDRADAKRGKTDNCDDVIERLRVWAGTRRVCFEAEAGSAVGEAGSVGTRVAGCVCEWVGTCAAPG